VKHVLSGSDLKGPAVAKFIEHLEALIEDQADGDRIDAALVATIRAVLRHDVGPTERSRVQRQLAEAMSGPWDCTWKQARDGDLKRVWKDVEAEFEHPNTHTPENRLDERPTVAYEQGQLHSAVSNTLEIMAGLDPPCFFQRGSDIVRVARLDQPMDVQGVTIPKSTTITVPLNPADAQARLCRHILYMRQTQNAEGRLVSQPIDPPTHVVRAVLEAVGDWQMPALIAVTDVPILRDDGSIMTDEGYDPTSGLFYGGGAPEIELPDAPTLEDARTAVDVIMEPLKEFPVAEGDITRSVMLAYLLTGLIRPLLPLAPCFVISATTAGTGKGLFIDIANLILHGVPPATMAALSGNHAEEEERKRITSVLLRGVGSIHIDNISEHGLGSDALNSLMTSEEWSDRVLGSNTTTTIPSRVLIAASGNNVQVRGDMVRRSLRAHFDAGMERPERRVFEISDLKSHVRINRPKFLSALYTVLVAYRRAGKPGGREVLLGSFEAWSEEVAGAIRWLGLPDPTRSQEVLFEIDPEMQNFAVLLTAWHAYYGSREMKAGDVIDEMAGGPINFIDFDGFDQEILDRINEKQSAAFRLRGPDGSGPNAPPDDTEDEEDTRRRMAEMEEKRELLRAAIDEAIGTLGDCKKRLGRYLKARKDRICGELRLKQGKDRHNKVAIYYVLNETLRG
jgi:hypothetical protein